MQKSDKQAVAASVTVYRVADMTDNGRKEVCDWLRKLARDIQREPETFAKTFHARYLYPANSVLCVNDRMTACEECGEEWPAGDHERWRLVNGQQVCAKCAKEAEPKREADAPPAKPRDSTGRGASAVAAMLPPKPRRMKANPKHSCEGNPYHGTEHDELASCVTIYLCEPVDAPPHSNAEAHGRRGSAVP